MTKKEIMKIAVAMGVTRAGAKSKKSLIQSIQGKEGNSQCFGSEACDNHGCLWFDECIKYHKVVAS